MKLMTVVHTLALIAIGSACSPETQFSEEESAVVGTRGATLMSADGLATLEIPADALALETRISIVAKVSSRSALKSAEYHFSPDGLHFEVPVTLSIAPFSEDAEELAIAFLPHDGSSPQQLASSRADGEW